MALEVAIVSTDAAGRLALVRSLEGGPRDWTLSVHDAPPAGADVVVCSPEVRLEGAVVVDPHAPGDAVARVKQAAAPHPLVIAVTSVEGGSGVTTIALHLAAALAARGAPTAFVDLDPGRGAHHRLAIEPQPSSGAARHVPVAGGFRFVADVGAATLDDVIGDDVQRVVIDVPVAGLDRVGMWVDVGLLVVRPTPAGASRARVVVEAHESIGWCPVVNRLGRGGQTTRAQVERILGGRVVELPTCPALRDVEDEDRLLSSRWTRWSRRVDALAGAVAP